MLLLATASTETKQPTMQGADATASQRKTEQSSTVGFYLAKGSR